MKETKVYVEELPESCINCPCCLCDLKPEFIKIGDFMYCNLLRQKFRFKEERKKLKDCPLIDIKTYDREKDKRIKELEQDLEFTTKTANELIEIKHKLEQELAELKEKAIVLPKNLQVGNKVFWANEDGLFIGEIKTISQDTAVWFYVVYDNGLTYWHLLKDFNNEVFATEQEAQAKLKEIQGNE